MGTYDAIICRQRAERIRVTGDGIPNQESRETMFRLAESYERMADALEAVSALAPKRVA
jgi:hypothetical protein